MKNASIFHGTGGSPTHFVLINSDNDPWGCDDKAGRELFDHLGGDLIIRHGAGHMGSTKFSQPYTSFPLISHLVDTFT